MKRYAWFLMVLISAGVGCLYFVPFLNNFFVYDDFRYLENLLYGPKGILIGYSAFRLVSNGTWYPLYQLFGFDPFGYNLFNLLLFILDGCLVYLFVQRLLGRWQLSLLTGTFFVMNAVIADAVFWKMSLSTLMCAAFYLLSLTAYVEYRRNEEKKYYWISIGIFLLAMFTKEDSASFPFAVILIELFVLKSRFDLKTLARRVLPYCAIIIFYLVLSKMVFHLLAIKPEMERFFKIRPLFSILAGYAVFFIRPSGAFSWHDPGLYITAAVIAAAFFVVKEKRILLFGLVWIMATFIPQSFSMIGQLDPTYVFHSIGRLLFLPSIGASLAAALVVTAIAERIPPKAAACFVAILLASYLSLGYQRVQYRGDEWRISAKHMGGFLPALKKKLPEILPNTMIYIPDNPTGRAYVQQALRAYYREPTITWVVDPFGYDIKPGKHFIWIFSRYIDDANFDPEVNILY